MIRYKHTHRIRDGHSKYSQIRVDGIMLMRVDDNASRYPHMHRPPHMSADIPKTSHMCGGLFSRRLRSNRNSSARTACRNIKARLNEYQCLDPFFESSESRHGQKIQRPKTLGIPLECNESKFQHPTLGTYLRTQDTQQLYVRCRMMTSWTIYERPKMKACSHRSCRRY